MGQAQAEARHLMVMKGYDPDGVAQTEVDYFEKCPACGEWFDTRDISQCLCTSMIRILRSAKVRSRHRAGVRCNRKAIATGPLPRISRNEE
jgi:hypothetical protein